MASDVLLRVSWVYMRYISRNGWDGHLDRLQRQLDQFPIHLLVTLSFLTTTRIVPRKDPAINIDILATEEHIILMPNSEMTYIQPHNKSKKGRCHKARPSNHFPGFACRARLLGSCCRAPPIVLRNWGPLTVSVKAALRYQKTMARLASCSRCRSINHPMSLVDIT